MKSNTMSSPIKEKMDATIYANFSKVSLVAIIVPLSVIAAILCFLFIKDCLSVEKYIQVQKELFIFFNAKLSQFPKTEYNLTQIGDAFIFLSFLSIFLIYAPRLWESLITGSLLTALFSNVFKHLFAIPRPAAALDQNSFVVIGKALKAHTSLPSGHSITIFAIITILFIAFMPHKKSYKALWAAFMLLIGLFLIFTRVAVGAHYPLDVLVGGSIGIICGILGIWISKKISIWRWIHHKKYYPFFILLFGACCVVLIKKISADPLIIYFLALISVVFTLYKTITLYVQK